MRKRTPQPRILVVISAICALLAMSSCAELEARRSIQKADKLYEEGEYAEAIEIYEAALEGADLATGHHNLAITAYTAFQPGLAVETPENAAYAKKASEHFQAYLKWHPDDTAIIDLLTKIWVNSKQIDEAVAFWEAALKKDPTNRKVLGKLGTIQRQAGNYSEALKWDYRRVELAKDPKDKARALFDIGNLQYRRLTKSTLLDAERIAVADSGISAMVRALELQPKNAQIHSLLATMYQFRALAHQTSWARLIDQASQRHHHIRRKELVDAQKAEANKHKPKLPGQTSEKTGQEKAKE